MCVFVCVCWERERVRKRERTRNDKDVDSDKRTYLEEKEYVFSIFNLVFNKKRKLQLPLDNDASLRVILILLITVAVKCKHHPHEPSTLHYPFLQLFPSLLDDRTSLSIRWGLPGGGEAGREKGREGQVGRARWVTLTCLFTLEPNTVQACASIKSDKTSHYVKGAPCSSSFTLST